MNSQEDFDLTFGALQHILSEQSTENNTESTRFLLQDYSANCKLDLLMNFCMWDNIFHDQVDTILNIQDVCRKISTIK